MDHRDYMFLYDGSRPNWILVTIEGREKIYNEADHLILNSFPPDLESKIIEQMKKAGIKILSSFPQGKRSTPRSQLSPGDWQGLRFELKGDEIPDCLKSLIQEPKKK